MPLVSRKRNRAFHASVLFAGALVIFQFMQMAPGASLQVQIGNVLNGTTAINNGILYQSNISLEESIGSTKIAPSKTTTKPFSESNTIMTGTMTLRHENESTVENPDNTAVHQEYSSNDTLTGRSMNHGAIRAKVPDLVTGSSMPQHKTGSTKLTTVRKRKKSLRGNTTFSVAETTNIKARLAALRERTRNATKQQKKANHTSTSIVLNKFNTTAGFIHLGN